MRALPHKHHNEHCKATEEEDDWRTYGKQISRKKCRSQLLSIGTDGRRMAVQDGAETAAWRQVVCGLFSTGSNKHKLRKSRYVIPTSHPISLIWSAVNLWINLLTNNVKTKNDHNLLLRPKNLQTTRYTHHDGIRIPPFNVTGIIFLKRQTKYHF